MPPMTTGRMKPKDAKQLIELREKMVGHFARLVASGTKFTAYRCNHCRKLIPTSCPTVEQVSSKGYWDSCTQCLSCGRLNFVLVWPTGRTRSLNMDEADQETTYRHVPCAFEIISRLTLNV